jgi:hypothetical protein
VKVRPGEKAKQMLSVIDREEEIAAAQGEFEAALRREMTDEIGVILGFQGGELSLPVMWLGQVGIWAHLGRVSRGRHGTGPPRYWNAFGIGRPGAGRTVAIECEINFPFGGIRRNVSGAYARESEGKAVHLLHRGRLTGDGLDKAYVKRHFDGEWVTINDGGIKAEVISLGPLDAAGLGRRVAHFVIQVRRLKDRAKAKAK